MKYSKLTVLFVLACQLLNAAPPGKTLNLNGEWDFEQTMTAFPPSKFTRKIPVPGLIHLATPKVEAYDKFFKRPDKAVDGGWGRELLKMDYTPRYSWYRKNIKVDKDLAGLEAILQIKKSKYVTQIYVNGIDLGSFIECFTPIDVAITHALKYGEENEILIKVGDRYWLPSAAAGGIDKEKEHYIPGIWDDVSISFSKKIHIRRMLVLPELRDEHVRIKAQLWNLNKFSTPGDPRSDSISYSVKIFKHNSSAPVAEAEGNTTVLRDQRGEIEIDLNIPDAHPWSPDDPYRYTAELTVQNNSEISDQKSQYFGMRDFERRGKSFYLNNEKIFLRGSNITLHRFFEDPKCRDLAWNRQWVKNMMIDISKEMDWNAMRICVGIVPDFWYDLADEYGILLQNEWMYWQMHGWDNQINKEYTDWVWADGSHPSIVIWDAINENRNRYIGNTLIPELKELDPTRIWDAGYMTASQMQNDDMDEPHTYQGRPKDGILKRPYPLGNLDFRPHIVKELEESGSAQLVNEYGWVWLWRDGTASKLSDKIYEYYLGSGSTVEERRKMQAYWLECETEWMRGNRHIAGVLAFCLLTNNYGYTGDWFTGDIKDLDLSPTLYWFSHCFAETTVFLNLTDERYAKGQDPHKPGSYLNFTLRGVNDATKEKKGQLVIKLLNSMGKPVYSDTISMTIPASDREDLPYALTLPTTPGGYVLVTEFTGKDEGQMHMSRRYIKIGEQEEYKFYDIPVPEDFSIKSKKSKYQKS